MRKYVIGIFYKNSNKYWDIDYLSSKLTQFKSIDFHLIETSNVFEIPDNLDIVTMIPSESELIPEIVKKNKNLKWIHSMWAGVDKFVNKKEIYDSDIILTNARGAYAESLSEFSIFSMLYFSFNAPLYISAYSQKKWVTPVNRMLKGKTLCIVGYGMNGVSIAKKAKSSFQMKIVGIRKEIDNPVGKEYVDQLLTIDKLSSIVEQVDFLVNILPHTSETINIYNYSLFSKMKSDAVFINIGRGSAVVEEDLIKALDEKIIRGASLDVFAIEPLNSESGLYNLDNVFISCHTADNTDMYFKEGVEVFTNNLKNYLEYGKLITIVDKNKGY